MLVSISRGLKRLNRLIGNPLEWTSSAKATLLGAITCLMYLHYALWGEVLLRFQEATFLLDTDYISAQLPYFYAFALCSFILTILPPILHKIYGDSHLYEYGATLYFGFSLSYFSFQIGTLSLPVGAVLVGAPVVGFIFFNRKAVVLALLLSLGIQLILSLGSAWHLWSYAPMFEASTEWGNVPTPFKVFQMYFYTLPHMIVLISISYLVLRRWRDREEKVRHLSVTDPLTGLFNRRSILLHLDQEQFRSRNKGPVMSLLMVDLDHFKLINDEKGHEAGDYALIAAADALQKCLRQNDRVGRYGGEEFLIILPGTHLEGAKYIAERCRQQLEKTNVVLSSGDHVKFTGSFGVICNEGNIHMQVDELLRQVDKALYLAKHQGRNQIVSVDLVS